MIPSRFGIIGDIHAEDERLAAALAIFEKQKVQQILFVGDIVDGRGDVERCITMLAQADAIGVRGNHDRWLLEERMRMLADAHLKSALTPAALAFLEALPIVRDITTPRGSLLLCHGVGHNDMVRLRPDDEGYALQTNEELSLLLQANHHALVVGGHTHEYMVKRFHARDVMLPGDASLVFLNAGALARAEMPCCSILDLDQGHARFYDLDDPKHPFELETQSLP